MVEEQPRLRAAPGQPPLPLRDTLFFSFPGNVALVAIVAQHLSALVGDMGCDSYNPAQDSEERKVSLDGRIHLGTVKDGLAVLPVGHLFLGEGGAEDILG